MWALMQAWALRAHRAGGGMKLDWKSGKTSDGAEGRITALGRDSATGGLGESDVSGRT